MESLEPIKRKNLFVRVVSALWAGLDASRAAAMNLVFLGIVTGLVIAAFSGGPKVPAGGALVLNPSGEIVEQLSGRSPRDFVGGLASGDPDETLLRDLLDAIRAAKGDKRIKLIVMDLDDLGGVGLSKLQDLRAALLEFRKSGKKVLATSDAYDQTSYYLASAADEIFLNPGGGVLLQGYSRYRRYYKEAIDRIGLEWHVFRVGEYKSAVEPYLRSDASEEAKAADLEWMGDLWASYLRDVSEARKKTPEELTALIDAYPERLKEAGGDLSELALREKLVDRVATRDEVRSRIIELAGSDEGESFRHVDFEDYLLARGVRTALLTGPAVAVVVAQGEILDGIQPPGRIGGDSTAALIKKAREDSSVKAVVLRVDSPGGSVFGSEIIRRELELVQRAKKPVVVSMGTLAASGGYWISMASDEIWAAPTTITGSIGIFGMFPSYGNAMAKHLGVHVDGVGTTWLAGALRPDRPLDPRVGEAIQSGIDQGYEEFLARVAAARKMSRDDVDRIARGRVWSGEDAQKLGLVDKLGSLSNAIASAAGRAKLGKDYRVTYVEKSRSLRDRFFSALNSRVAVLHDEPRRLSPIEASARELLAEVEGLAIWNDPQGRYAHCLCEPK